jgi:hypothetical protein
MGSCFSTRFPDFLDPEYQQGHALSTDRRARRGFGMAAIPV